MLYNEDYVNGSFKRRDLRGTFLYSRFNRLGLFVDRAKGNYVLKDTLAIAEAEDIDAYNLEIGELFKSFEDIEKYTDEEIIGIIQGIRKKHFKNRYYNEIRNKNIEDIAATDYIKGGNLKELLPYVFYKNNESFKSYINRDELIVEMLQKKERDLIIFSDDIVDLARLLKILEISSIKKKSIKIFVKEEQIINEPTREWVEYVLDKMPLTIATQIELIDYQNKGLGMNLRNLSEKAESTLKSIKDAQADLLLTGETNLFSLTDSEVSYYIISSIEGISAQIYTNSFMHSDKIPTYVSTFVEAGYKTAIDFSGVERRRLSLQHYDKLYFNQLESVINKKNVLEGNAVHGLNPASPTFDAKDFKDKIPDSDNTDQQHFKDDILNKLAEREMNKRGLKYINSYYDYKDFEKSSFEYNPSSERNGVLIKGVKVENNRGLNLSTQLAEDYNTGIISIREILEKGRIDKDFTLYNNFLYFFTFNLQRLYNTVRSDRPNEHLTFKDFYLGYRYQMIEGNKKEFFPLYNKGYVGFKPDGSVIFGRKELNGGRLKLGNLELQWNKEEVNNLEEDFTIITPMLLRDEKGSNEDFRQYRKTIGKDRYNVVIVNDRVVCARFGDVVLPSIGVVLSFSSKVGEKAMKTLGFTMKENGYYKTNDLDFYLDLDKNEDENQCQWIMGGGTLLMKDGKSLMSTEKDSFQNFFEEGWHNPLSMQTQETQVQDWVRGPRAVMGITEKEELFTVSFSGRSNETAGARFDEVITIIEKEMGPVKEMINLDGGASVCFGMVYHGEFFELSIPAPSDFNIRGMVRPVNSMILLKKEVAEKN